MEELRVYENRQLGWLWLAIYPLSIYLLSAAWLQGFGIYLPGFSEPIYPTNWGARIFIGVILFFWLRDAPATIRRVISRKPVLIVNDTGIKTPNFGELTWGEIGKISNSFGWVKFEKRQAPEEGFKLFSVYLDRHQWKQARERIAGKLPEGIAVKF